MTEHTGRSWLNYLLGLLCVGAVVVAILVVGPASGSQTAVTRTARAARGVVQSTVSGSGNLQPASQLNLGFRTSGTVTQIHMTQGQHVTQGQLLATLDPQSAEVTLEQAKATLLSAEANLAKEEETDGEGATGSGTAGSGTAGSGTAGSGSSSGGGATAAAASAQTGTREGKPKTDTSSPTVAGSSPGESGSSGATSGTCAKTGREGEGPADETDSASKTSSSSDSKTSSSSSTEPTISAATREANLASARAAVSSDRLTVRGDEQAVQDTKLYAPEDGTIVSLSGQVGEVVSASGTTKASGASSSTSSGSSGSGASTASGASSVGRSGTGASSSSSSSGSSSSPFAVLSDLSSMQLVVALSESEIGNVKVGQIATVTVEALEGRTLEGTGKLAAHVKEVAILSTSSSGVVSYDVTFQLDQMDSGLKPGMSATAEVVVKQAEGVNVPSSAISAGSVTVVRSGKDVRQRVTTGLAGNSSTIVLSGLKAGETVVLPAAASTSSTSLTSRLGARSGGISGARGLTGAGGGFGGGGGAAFFRGGG